MAAIKDRPFMYEAQLTHSDVIIIEFPVPHMTLHWNQDANLIRSVVWLTLYQVFPDHVKMYNIKSYGYTTLCDNVVDELTVIGLFLIF